MPIYEYKCKICEQVTEVMQKINDPPVTKCPVCEQDTLQKIFSAAVFNLKGEGFHKPGMS